MKAHFQKVHSIWKAWVSVALLITATILACSETQTAGIETGNPEVITIAFNISNDSSAAISAFGYKFMGATLQKKGLAAESLWNEPNGELINFATGVYSKKRNLDGSPLSGVNIRLWPSAGNGQMPESSSFEEVNNPRFIKLKKNMSGQEWRIYFECPQNWKMNLYYGENSLKKMSKGDTLRIPVTFNCDSWARTLAKAGVDTLISRRDGKDHSFFLLDTKENIAAYNLFKTQLKLSFIADSVNFD